MKKLLCSMFLLVFVLTTLCSCSVIPTDKNNIGKSANTAVTVASALKDVMASRKKTGYQLYGVKMLVNGENVGKYTYVYTKKRTDVADYSDILIVEVNNRNGKIERFGAPDSTEDGAMPYEMIESAMPLYPETFSIDSGAALKKAEDEHFANSFSYSYIETCICYKDGFYVYDINHISLVNDCVYNTVIDVSSGEVISSAVKELE